MDVPDNFGGLGEPFCSKENAKVVILPIPFEGTVSFGTGTGAGPEAIIEASQHMELYDEDIDWDTAEVGIYTAPPVPIVASAKEQIDIIQEHARPYIEEGKFLFALGGEHSITTGYIRELKKKYPDLSILQIDAHLDLRDDYEGEPFSHASVMRRIHDLGVPFVQVGIRSLSHEEKDFLDENDLEKNVFYARDIVPSQDKKWIEDVVSKLSGTVFITIDIDGFDPSIVPATGTPEPGGLGWYQGLDLLRAICAQKEVIGADLVELSPIKGHHASDFLCAKLAYKLLGMIFSPKR